MQHVTDAHLINSNQLCYPVLISALKGVNTSTGGSSFLDISDLDQKLAAVHL